MKVNKMHNTLTLKSALDKLKSKEISIQDLYRDTQKAIAENKNLNIFLNLDKKALENAEKAQDTPLKGVPIAVKDNFCTKDLNTTASSKILEHFVPQYDSTVAKKIKKAGGVIIGKTNLDAWAHGSSTETSDFGRTLNARNMNHLPGGSSGGSASAVASNTCIASIGSETAGSIRLPASWCGVVGLKPTYGRVSRYGVIAMASSTDSPGPITKTVEDSAIMLNFLAGHDPNDGTTSQQAVPDYTTFLDKPIKDLKIGIIYSDIEGLEEIQPLFQEQIKVFEKLGAKVEFAKAMDPHYAISVYTIVQRGEVSSNLGRYDGIRYGLDRSNFGSEAKRRIMLGTYAMSKESGDQAYELAQKVRTLFIEDYKKLFSKYDVLIAPTTPSYADEIGSSEKSAMYGELADMLLEPSSITGLPGISVPFHHNKKTNLFLGMNIIAPMWREDLVIQVGDAFEKNTNWNTWRNK
jgi:aspartyl-tRNA(Asn)/glutamyl-tRNA(Gln) amidotransferase subunit A